MKRFYMYESTYTPLNFETWVNNAITIMLVYEIVYVISIFQKYKINQVF